METRLLFLHALSPLHAGTGQGIGVIDLPISKEKATSLPFLPGSSVKGALRDLCTDPVTRKKVFGPDSKNGDASEHSSAVQFSDQRLLLLPVRSLVGTFAWVTSPYILRRFARDAGDVGIADFKLPVSGPGQTQQCLLVKPNAIANSGKVYLEDLDCIADDTKTEAAQWAGAIAKKLFPTDATWEGFLRERFCIVSDDIMSFLVETATEVSARIHLKDDSKTVADGGLWYEEALPCETVTYGIVTATRIGIPKKNGQPNEFDYVEPTFAIEVVEGLMRTPVQFGGKATAGRGVCHLTMTQQQGGKK